MTSCHHTGIQIDAAEGAKRIVLAGNPNVGKSVFFNTLTGLYVDVSNYPGTTLEISHGKYGNDLIIDTPGVYGISSFNDEERIARDIILSADMVINIVDAVHLERDLFLTQQIIDTGVPMIVALNMMDEAEKQGIAIDVNLLSDLLGVPVVSTIAVTGQGLETLKEQINHSRPGHMDPALKDRINKHLNRVGSQGEALLILEDDPIIAERHGVKTGGERENIYNQRRIRVNDIINHVVKEVSQGASLSTRLGRWMVQPLTGIPILALFLWGMYELIGVFIAGTVVGITEETIMQGIYEPFVRGLIEPIFSQSSAIGTILIGEFGVLTMTVTYIFGLLLPLVLGFYLALSTFEDSGYLPRVATLSDRVMMGVGLNGRAVIPLILGFGCVTLATIVTRVLASERERKIAIFLLGLAIPCSAQMAVVAGLLAKVSTAYVILYILVIFTILALVGTLLNKILPGDSSDLFIDLPPLRLPRIENILKKTSTKTFHFLKEATPLFAFGSLIIGLLQISGLLVKLQDLLAPLTVGWLNLPKEASTVFIMGFVRRDFGAAGLNHMPLTDIQIIIGLVTITLFVPCIASGLVLFKERGRKEAAKLWLTIIATAFLVGGIVAQSYKLFGSVNGIIYLFLAILGTSIIIAKLPKANLPFLKAKQLWR